MKASKKVFILAGYLALGIMASCEIEDEYSNPDRSEHLGTKIYTGNNVPAALLWSENTNEIIVVSIDGIAAIEATSQKVRKLPFSGSNIYTQSAWVVGNTIYQLNSNGELSRVDLTKLSFIGNLVDSAFIQVLSSPFTATHFAYAKYDPTEYVYSVFLFDLKSHLETYVGTGIPYVFSPDGKQLVISNNGNFFVYDLTTKAITALNFNEADGTKLIMWTTDGIISFQQQGESIVARNESTGAHIGEWKSIAGLYGGVVSPSGNHIITAEGVCSYGNTPSGYCPNGEMLKHSIVDVNTSVEVPMAYAFNSSIYLRAFSPDEKTFAIATYDNSVYITEPQD
jgi:WD40 repeat protein